MSTSPTPVDGKSLAIGVLSITACILFVSFLVVTALPRPASAVGMSDAGGDYKMLTQQLTNSREALVVMDAAAQRVILYGFDANRKQLVPISGFDFENLNRPPAADEAAPNPADRKP